MNRREIWDVSLVGKPGRNLVPPKLKVSGVHQDPPQGKEKANLQGTITRRKEKVHSLARWMFSKLSPVVGEKREESTQNLQRNSKGHLTGERGGKQT